MSPTTRREFLKDAALAGAALTTFAESNLLAAAPAQAQAQRSAVAAVAGGVTLSWLAKDPPAVPTGVSWGVPWPQGRVARGATFSLTAEAKALPLQSWPLAYWPDGSIKWTGFASVLPAGFEGPLTLSPGSPLMPRDSKGIAISMTHSSSMSFDLLMVPSISGDTCTPELHE